MELRNERGLRKRTIALQRKASANGNESQAVIRTIFPRKLYNADVSEDMARKIFRFAGAPASRFVDFFRPGDAARDSPEITKPDRVSPLARESREQRAPRKVTKRRDNLPVHLRLGALFAANRATRERGEKRQWRSIGKLRSRADESRRFISIAFSDFPCDRNRRLKSTTRPPGSINEVELGHTGESTGFSFFLFFFSSVFHPWLPWSLYFFPASPARSRIDLQDGVRRSDTG